MQERVYLKSCQYCASSFETTVRNARLCPVCRSFTKQSGTKRKNVKSVSQFVSEVEAYNRAHGLHLTYGQYSLLCGKGGRA